MSVEASTIFLVVPITKPIVISDVVKRVENGLAVLDDPVTEYGAEFGENEKEYVQVRHLLTHTSGLLIPENYNCRESERPQGDFVKGSVSCRCPLSQ